MGDECLVAVHGDVENDAEHVPSAGEYPHGNMEYDPDLMGFAVQGQDGRKGTVRYLPVRMPQRAGLLVFRGGQQDRSRNPDGFDRILQVC